MTLHFSSDLVNYVEMTEKAIIMASLKNASFDINFTWFGLVKLILKHTRLPSILCL